MSYTIWKVLIFLLHILLLGWILYILYEGGTLPTSHILLHFTGAGFFGAFLIRFTAWITKRHTLKELEKRNSHS